MSRCPQLQQGGSGKAVKDKLQAGAEPVEKVRTVSWGAERKPADSCGLETSTQASGRPNNRGRRRTRGEHRWGKQATLAALGSGTPVSLYWLTEALQQHFVLSSLLLKRQSLLSFQGAGNENGNIGCTMRRGEVGGGGSGTWGGG